MTSKAQVKAWVSEDVKEAFEQFVIDTHGQKYGNMSREIENAMKYYADRDRYKRVDDKLDEVLGRLNELDRSHTHKQSETVEKAGLIERNLRQDDNTVIPEEDIIRAIEDVAGGDARTLEKYQDVLKRRAIAFEHPNDDNGVWTLERDEWLDWAVNYLNNNPGISRTEIIEGYPIGYNEIEQLAVEVLE